MGSHWVPSPSPGGLRWPQGKLVHHDCARHPHRIPILPGSGWAVRQGPVPPSLGCPAPPAQTTEQPLTPNVCSSVVSTGPSSELFLVPGAGRRVWGERGVRCPIPWGASGKWGDTQGGNTPAMTPQGGDTPGSAPVWGDARFGGVHGSGAPVGALSLTRRGQGHWCSPRERERRNTHYSPHKNTPSSRSHLGKLRHVRDSLFPR